jgi:hypothetical protein
MWQRCIITDLSAVSSSINIPKHHHHHHRHHHHPHHRGSCPGIAPQAASSTDECEEMTRDHVDGDEAPRSTTCLYVFVGCV